MANGKYELKIKNAKLKINFERCSYTVHNLALVIIMILTLNHLIITHHYNHGSDKINIKKNKTYPEIAIGI